MGILIFRHIRQSEAIVVGMLNPFLCHLTSIEIGKTTVETWITVYHAECIVVDNLNLIVLRNIGETHVLAVPLKFPMEAIKTSQTNGYDTHVDHFSEGT